MNKERELEFSENRTISRLYWIVIAGVILYVVLDVAAQLLPPHYSPIRDAESDLAVGPYGYVMTINFLNRGLLSLAFVFAFLRTVKLAGGNRGSFKSGYLLLGTWAIGAILLAFFPTDVPATPVSWHGGIHLVVAIVAFIGGAFGTLAISQHLGESTFLAGAGRLARPLSYLSVFFWGVEFLTPFVLPHFVARFGGLLERLFLGSVLLWMLVVSMYVVRSSWR
jgi:hypothetical membrane protein